MKKNGMSNILNPQSILTYITIKVTGKTGHIFSSTGKTERFGTLRRLTLTSLVSADIILETKI